MSRKTSIQINLNSRHVIRNCISSVLVVTGLLQGQDEEPKEIESHYILPDIVITATRTSQTLQEVPLSTTLVSQELIDMIPAMDVADVLQVQTGTTVRRTSHGGMTTISLRGTQAAQVLVTRDGIPINDAFNGTTDLSQLSLGSIEKIEIVRGPTSHLYGANALGGVINLITREVGNARDITLSQGSFNTQAMTAHAGMGNSEKGVSMSANLDRSDGWRGNDDYMHRSWTGNAVTVMRGVEFGFTTGYHDTDLGVPGPKPAAAPTFGNAEVSSLFNRQTSRNLFGMFTLNSKLWEKVAVELHVRPELNKTLFMEKYGDYFTGEPVLGDYEYRSQNLRISGQTETPLKDHRILGGFEIIEENGFVTQWTRNESGTNQDTTDWESQTEAWAFWTEFIGQWNPLTVVGGMRMDVHSVYGRHVSPSLGFILKMQRQVLKLSLGKAYRAPTHNDLFWPNLGNPDLKPEEGIAGEISYEYYFLPTLWTKAAVFRRVVDDMIAWVPSGSTGLWQPTNINRLQLSGMEIELTARSSSFNLTLGYMFMEGEQVNHELTYSDWMTGTNTLDEVTRPSAFVPGHSVTGCISWISPGMRISVTSNWRSEIVNYYEDWSQAPEISRSAKELPARTLVNLKVVLPLGNVQPYLVVKNLLDEQYSDQFGTDLHDLDFPMPDRILEVGMRLKF
ncbi:TonB-dependent receptor [Candidatus Neomarinimicrobiota bacterium]